MNHEEIQRLEEAALSSLSNYEGEGYEGYSGYGDDFMDFDGLDKTFKNAIMANRVYTFVVTQNPIAPAVDAACEFYLTGGFLQTDYTQSGNIGLGVMKQGNFRALSDNGVQLNANGVQCSIDAFTQFIKRNPTQVLGFKIGVTDASQIDNMVITVEEQSPFRALGTRKIIPSIYVNETTYRDKIVTVPEGFDYNDQVSVKVNMVAACHSMTITYICGGILNPAAALKNKSTRAMRHGNHPHSVGGKKFGPGAQRQLR